MSLYCSIQAGKNEENGERARARENDKKIEVKSRQCEIRRKRKEKRKNGSNQQKANGTKTNWCVCSCVRALNCPDNSVSRSLAHSLSLWLVQQQQHHWYKHFLLWLSYHFFTIVPTTEIHTRTHNTAYISIFSVFLLLYSECTKMDCLLTGMESMMPKIRNEKKPWCAYCSSARQCHNQTTEQPLRMYCEFVCVDMRRMKN